MNTCIMSGLWCFFHYMLCLVASDSGMPWTAVCQAPVHGDSPGKNTEVGCHALLQGHFPTQGSNPGLPHCRWILHHLSLKLQSLAVFWNQVYMLLPWAPCNKGQVEEDRKKAWVVYGTEYSQHLWQAGSTRMGGLSGVSLFLLIPRAET